MENDNNIPRWKDLRILRILPCSLVYFAAKSARRCYPTSFAFQS